MNNLQKRFLLFIFGCLGTRLGIAILADKINKQYLPIMGGLALIPAIGFLYLYFFGTRTTGAEVFGGKIWWNDLRLIHGLIYVAFAVYAFQKKRFAAQVLYFDVMLGLISFLVYHYHAGNLVSTQGLK